MFGYDVVRDPPFPPLAARTRRLSCLGFARSALPCDLQQFRLAPWAVGLRGPTVIVEETTNSLTARDAAILRPNPDCASPRSVRSIEIRNASS